MARILIVDDEVSYRRTLTAICRRAGHESCAATTGPEAIEVARKFEPDLLIADWGLAGAFDGLELGRRLQIEKAELQVVLITGYSAQGLGEIEAPRLFAILEKPFGVEDVRNTLSAALESGDSRSAPLASASSQ